MKRQRKVRPKYWMYISWYGWMLRNSTFELLSLMILDKLVWMEVFCFICMTYVIEKHLYFFTSFHLHVFLLLPFFVNRAFCAWICSFKTASMYPFVYFKQQWHHQIESNHDASSRLVMVADCKAQMSETHLIAKMCYPKSDYLEKIAYHFLKALWLVFGDKVDEN